MLEWFNPRTGERRTEICPEGPHAIEAPDAQDWALHIRKMDGEGEKSV